MSWRSSAEESPTDSGNAISLKNSNYRSTERIQPTATDPEPLTPCPKVVILIVGPAKKPRDTARGSSRLYLVGARLHHTDPLRDCQIFPSKKCLPGMAGATTVLTTIVAALETTEARTGFNSQKELFLRLLGTRGPTRSEIIADKGKQKV